MKSTGSDPRNRPLGEFRLSSDTVIPSFDTYKNSKEIVAKISRTELEKLNYLSYTIGGMMIFPGNRINGKQTINGRRGCHHKIRDRFDLTVECIRRYYLGLESPLSDTFNLYPDFFRLFQNFENYISFFHLQDLVSNGSEKVLFFMPFDDFKSSPIPETIESYISYLNLSIEFINSRNSRIEKLGLTVEV